MLPACPGGQARTWRGVPLRPLGGLPDSEAQGVHHKCLPSTAYISPSPLGLELHEKELSPVIMESAVEPTHDRRAQQSTER